jgi:hypothetical protein
MSNAAVIKEVSEGYRMPSSDNCPPRVYEVMLACWNVDPAQRPSWEILAKIFEKLIEEYHQPSTMVADCKPTDVVEIESPYN